MIIETTSDRIATSVLLALSLIVALVLLIVASTGPNKTSPRADVPSSPAVTALERPVTLRWAKMPYATSYRVYRNGALVKTVAAEPANGVVTQETMVLIPCTGDTLSVITLKEESTGRSPRSSAKEWRC